MKTHALLFISVLWGCGSGSGGGKDASPEAGRHSDPLGFSLVKPDGWSASFEKGAYVEVKSPDARSRGIVLPFLAPQATTAESCVTRAAGAFPEAMPQARVEQVKTLRKKPDEAVGRIVHGKGVARALCSIDGASGVLFLAVVPKENEAEGIAQLTAVFESLKFTEPTQGAQLSDAPAGPEVEWLDPLEKSFRVKVPQGWKAEGGLYRGSAVDVRIHVRLTSPDGATTVAVGDKDIPPLVTPMAGFPEGSTYNPGYGTSFYVKRFTTGGAFAAEYGTRAAGSVGCPNAQAQGKELEDLTRRMQAEADKDASAGARKIASAGEARFGCGSGASERVGYIFAATQLTTASADLSGIWGLTLLGGYASPKAKETEARGVIARLYTSFAWDPTWYQAQQGTTASTAQIVTKTGNDVAAIYSGSNAASQVVMDEAYRNWSNATLGQTDVVDPTTGEAYKVASGKNYYWRKAGTNVVGGTDTYDRPDIDFTPMEQF